MEGGGERRRDGLERNRSAERSGQTGTSSARLSVSSQSEKNSRQPAHRCLLLTPNERQLSRQRGDFQTSLSCLMLSFYSRQTKKHSRTKAD